MQQICSTDSATTNAIGRLANKIAGIIAVLLDSAHTFGSSSLFGWTMNNDDFIQNRWYLTFMNAINKSCFGCL